MIVLVAYYSETGNTEKIARAIYEEVLKEHEVHLKKIYEVTAETLNSYDLVFLGSPCHSTDLVAPVKRILETLPNSPKIKLAGFFTHATSLPEDKFPRARELFYRWAGKCVVSFEKISKAKKIDFKGYYHCQGAPSPPIEDFIRREVLSSDEWEDYGEEVRKHPIPEDVQKAKKFARGVLSKL